MEPVEIEIINKTAVTQTFRFYLCNFTETIEPNDSVKLTASNSESLAYYTKIKEELAGGGDKEVTPEQFAKLFYPDLEILNVAMDRENEECTDYLITIKRSKGETNIGMRIYNEDKVVEYLDEGTPGPYIAESEYGSKTQYANRDGVVIGYQQIWE